MTIASNKSEVRVVEYAPDDTFFALTAAIKKSSHFSIKSTDPAYRTIHAHAGFSFRSIGENIKIVVSPTENGMSQISVSSVSKMALIDWGKNKDNLDMIMRRLAEELTRFQKVTG